MAFDERGGGESLEARQHGHHLFGGERVQELGLVGRFLVERHFDSRSGGARRRLTTDLLRHAIGNQNNRRADV